MPDEVPMVTSCPLCLAPDEVSSMVTIEIERKFQPGRTAIMICRSCAGAVIRACDGLEPPLVDPKVFQLVARAEAPADLPGSVDIEEIFGDPPVDETQAESARLHEGEEPDTRVFEDSCPHGYAFSNCPEGCSDGTATD